MSVNFFEEGVSFKPEHPQDLYNWINHVITNENRCLKQLNFIFCSDKYLHKINVKYLSHDTFTDIITFDHSENEAEIEGDIFISIDRVEDNAKKIGFPFIQELSRVIIHGVLHLIGYNDKSKEEIKIMRKKEEAYLSLQHRSERA